MDIEVLPSHRKRARTLEQLLPCTGTFTIMLADKGHFIRDYSNREEYNKETPGKREATVWGTGQMLMPPLFADKHLNYYPAQRLPR